MSAIPKPDPKVSMMMLEEAELALIALECITGRERPDGMTAAEALDDARLPPDVRVVLHEISRRTVDYFVKCMNAGGIETESRYTGGRHDA
jgi:hypothetical protein